MSFFDSLVSGIGAIVQFLNSIAENTIALVRVIRDAVETPSLFSGWMFQPLAICIVVVVAVAVLKNILGRV